MIKKVDFYYFSPTGGTKKAGEALASQIAEEVREVSFAEKTVYPPAADIAVVAAPVFGGRIPAIVSEKIAAIDGKGKKAITAVVYGVRAYEDALLELNDAVRSSGFEVVASAALAAQHSIVPAVGAGRPDQVDMEEIRQFARRILSSIESGKTVPVSVPGNRPYKEKAKNAAAPVSLPNCSRCGHCAAVCPTEAIAVVGEGVETDTGKCMMCMACVAQCSVQARILPPPLQAAITEKLSVFKAVRRENEFYIFC